MLVVGKGERIPQQGDPAGWESSAVLSASSSGACTGPLPHCIAYSPPLLPPPCPPAGLSLPQAQVLGELFGGRGALLDPPRPATIKSLVAFQAYWDRHPHLYDQICQVRGATAGREEGPCVAMLLSLLLASAAACSSLRGVRPMPAWPLVPPPPTRPARHSSFVLLSALKQQVFNTAYQVVAHRAGAQGGAQGGDFSFRAFMDGPVAHVRRKPAKARCANPPRRLCVVVCLEPSKPSRMSRGMQACQGQLSWWGAGGRTLLLCARTHLCVGGGASGTAEHS